jgi:hypothetical protein
MATTVTAGDPPSEISEKTVELNLSIEIVNFLFSRQNRPAFAWGPTLRQEARWGFDAAYGLQGQFIYVQFKRAHSEGPGHLFQLNRTTARDQHQKLQTLEASGLSVRYALPRFTTMAHIEMHRRRLLLPQHTAWLRPSQIPMPNSGVGHHDLHIHPTRRWLTSDPIELSSEDDNPFLGGNPDDFTWLERGTSERWAMVFEKIFGNDEEATRNAAILFLPR